MGTPNKTDSKTTDIKNNKTPVGDKELNKGRTVEDPELEDMDDADMSADEEDLDIDEDDSDEDSMPSTSDNKKVQSPKGSKH